jgi:hypothetical protein
MSKNHLIAAVLIAATIFVMSLGTIVEAFDDVVVQPVREAWLEVALPRDTNLLPHCQRGPDGTFLPPEVNRGPCEIRANSLSAGFILMDDLPPPERWSDWPIKAAFRRFFSDLN